MFINNEKDKSSYVRWVLLWSGLLIVACVVFFLRETFLPTEEVQPKRGIVYVDESTNEASPALENIAKPKVEKLRFISFLSDTQSINVACGSIEKTSSSRVSIVITEGSGCKVTATDKAGDVYSVTISQPQTGTYICFSEGKQNCVLGEEPALSDAVSSEKKKVSRSTNAKQQEVPVSFGYITISADEDAQVFINGKKIRKVPLFKFKSTVGLHRVHLVSSNGKLKKFNSISNSFRIRSSSRMPIPLAGFHRF